MKHFNEGFFSTAALVIPVLFLALTLQGDFALRALAESKRWNRKMNETLLAKGKRPSWQRVVIGYVQSVLMLATALAGVAVFVWGLNGEITAFLALERQSASAASASRVMQAVVVLTVAIGIAFVVRFFGATNEEQRRSNEGRQGEDTAPAPQASEEEGQPPAHLG